MFKTFDPLKGRQLEVLDQEGKIKVKKWVPQLDDDKLVEAYKTMLYARVADIKAVSLQRQGRIYTLPANMGQEAAAVGSALAIEKSDWMVTAYRELGAWLVKGVTMKHYFLYFGGSEEGSRYAEDARITPVAVPISSQLPHAVGIAHAINYRGEKDVVLAYFGDGGTSQGDFHEAMNWAAVYNCPVIFFCNNNQYAISLSRKKQTRSETLAQKAIAYEMPGIQVDGNDFLAVYRATSEAVKHARSGKGPVLIEAVTYRMGAHTTSDDPGRYRTKEEEEEWKGKDPLKRMKIFLEEKKLWDDKKEKEYRSEAEEDVAKQFREVENMAPPKVDDIFKYQFAELPDSLKQQQVELQNFLARREGR